MTQVSGEEECTCHYGLAPHTHDLSGGSFIGSTREISKDQWPSNFTEDPEEPGLGFWTCDNCVQRTIQSAMNKQGW